VIADLRPQLDEMKQQLAAKDQELQGKDREIDRLYGKLAAASPLMMQRCGAPSLKHWIVWLNTRDNGCATLSPSVIHRKKTMEKKNSYGANQRV
jgi:hypothetical protein